MRRSIRTTSSTRRILQLLRPFVVRSYYDEREDVFRIDNVVWRDGGLAFDVVILPQSAPPA